MDVRDYITANAAEFSQALRDWPAGDPGPPLVFVAVGLDADRIHAPNEYVDLSRLLRGAESIAYLREELAGAAGAGA
jgi:acetylornithine deacetylase/succinyl-diaminopimelate desuccinylase-like protein